MQIRKTNTFLIKKTTHDLPDIRVSQAQTGEVQQRHGCSSTDEDEKGDQL